MKMMMMMKMTVMKRMMRKKMVLRMGREKMMVKAMTVMQLLILVMNMKMDQLKLTTLQARFLIYNVLSCQWKEI
jgi:hypothetical protein